MRIPALRALAVDLLRSHRLSLLPRQRKVIEWLLNHDPALRPTAQELLKSELMPPPQMEESELHEVLQHTMANVNGKAYRTMVGQLFAQNTTPVMDFTYDIDLHKVQKHKLQCYERPKCFSASHHMTGCCAVCSAPSHSDSRRAIQKCDKQFPSSPQDVTADTWLSEPHLPSAPNLAPHLVHIGGRQKACSRSIDVS